MPVKGSFHNAVTMKAFVVKLSCHGFSLFCCILAFAVNFHLFKNTFLRKSTQL